MKCQKVWNYHFKIVLTKAYILIIFYLNKQDDPNYLVIQYKYILISQNYSRCSLDHIYVNIMGQPTGKYI